MKDLNKPILISLVIYLVSFLWCGNASGQLVHVVNATKETRKECHGSYCTIVRMVEHGSGVVIGRDDRTSYVLTAAHVVSSEPYKLTVHGHPAVIVKSDRENDIAVLRVNNRFESVTPATFGEDLQSGEIVRREGFGGQKTASGSVERAISDRYVTGIARDGDSGGPIVSKGAVLRGIITHVDPVNRQTRLTPVSYCRQFVIGCVPSFRPRPAVVNYRAIPPPPTETAPDVPDVEKTARIRDLEQQVADLRQQLSSLKPMRGERGEPGAVGPRGAQGPAGPPGPAGTDNRPIDVEIVAVGPDGRQTVIASESYKRGKPIRLVFREEWIRSGE